MIKQILTTHGTNQIMMFTQIEQIFCSLIEVNLKIFILITYPHCNFKKFEFKFILLLRLIAFA